MAEVIDVKKINLNDFPALEEQVRVIINFSLVKEAFLLAQELEKKLDDNSLMRNSRYEDVLIKLKWISLSKLKNEEVVKLFAGHFIAALELEGYDVWEKLRAKIINDILYEERDQFKEQIKKALLKNGENITKKKITINEEEALPSIANWIKDYNINLGFEEIDAAKQSQYLTNSRNVKDLDEEDRRRLKILFQLYEKLKISSLTAMGFEEGLFVDEDNVKGSFQGGIFTKLEPQIEKRIAMLTELINEESLRTIKEEQDLKPADENVVQDQYFEEKATNAYVFTLPEQELIKEEEEDIKRIARGNIILIGKELTKALDSKDRIRTIAALRMAVKNNLLIGWAKKNSQKNNSQRSGNNSEDGEAVIDFLRRVLEEKLGLSEHEAAKIGVHLYNLLKKLGRDVGYLAYFDEDEEKFKWMV